MTNAAPDPSRPTDAAGSPAFTAADVDRFHADGWWTDETLWDVVEGHASRHPEGDAFIGTHGRLSWRDYRDAAHRLAGHLLAAGLDRGDRLAIWLPDGPTVHVAFLAAELAGLVTVGVGARAGTRELHHLVGATGARAILCHPRQRDADTSAVAAELGIVHIAIDDDAATVTVGGIEVGPPDGWEATLTERRFGPDELWLINSTSGTTGLPKCVMHTQNRWRAFHRMAVTSGALTGADVFCSAIPAPFGFGLWTAHFTPSYLGSPCVVPERFHPDELLRSLADERVSVLACVSTQFIMMLASPELEQVDLSALRVMFTGGEAVPYERAAAFEDQTGATVLQFYGSNETGAISYTTLEHPREVRLRTAGSLIDVMQVRLFGEDSGEEILDGHRGRPAGRGPAACLGYWGDAGANAQLFTDDGWMLMGDVVEIDDAGHLSVVGRTSDFIIRGGKNISAPAVEELVSSHPSIALAAAVAVPDPVFGERVAIIVQLRSGASVTLDDVVTHLKGLGAGNELLPEFLFVVDELPRSSGGKVAKGDLRELVKTLT